jgi:sugar lactone lactonase YvrE
MLGIGWVSVHSLMPVITSRLAFFSSLSLLALCGALSVACDGGSSPGAGADAGPIPEGDGGTPDAAACAATGTGTIAIVVTGLPAGVAAKVTVTGPGGAPSAPTTSTTLADSAAGTYAVTADRVAKADAIVRTLYEPKVSSSSFCLEEKKTQTITIAYSEVASSNKLWMTTGNSASGQVLGFAGADLAATGSPAARVAMKGAPAGGPGKGVAFDKEGNLWSIGATTADPPLLRFAAGDLGASGVKTPDRRLAPDLGGCGPAAGALAFAPSGALWVTVSCLDKVLRVAPETLALSKEYAPAAEDFATGTQAPRGVAFDASGNMWISDDTSIHLYPAASLAVGQPHTPTFALKAKAANDAELPPDALAFDKDGNLWVTSFGGNVIYKLTPADLAVAGATKDVIPSVQITVSVGALLESLAFDESGGLWFTYSQGKVARLAPTQLGTSTGPGDPTIPQTIVTSADIGYAVGTAFFPAAAALPLYSRF